jgi:putative lipoic acid-binding regulatory protein
LARTQHLTRISLFRQTGDMQNPADEIFPFPCPYPLKVIGRTSEIFIPMILSIIGGIAGPIRKESVVSRLSSNGKYLSLTVTIVARDRKQLESIYREVRKHRDVVFVL